MEEKTYYVIYQSNKRIGLKINSKEIQAKSKGEAKEIFYQDLPKDFVKFLEVIR